MYKTAIRLKNKVKYPYNKCYTISTYTCSLKQTITISFNECQKQAGLVAQRITRLTTDQKIAGSNPAWIENLFEIALTSCEMCGKRKRPRVGSNHQPFG